MGQADWTELTNVLAAGVVRRGVSMAPAFAAPDGNFIFGMHSLLSTAGVVAQRNNQAGFTPSAAGKAGVVEACIRRYNVTLGYAPFIGLLDNLDVDVAKGYLLGLSDEASYKICLKKGLVAEDILSTDSGVLRSSTTAYTVSQWHHLKLEVVLNPQGDIVLNCYANDLDTYAPGSAVWTAIGGMDRYVDDSLGILQGALPYTGTYYFVMGAYFAATARAALFDYYRAAVQLNP